MKKSLSLLFFISLFIFTSCDNKKQVDSEDVVYSEQIAKIISSSTHGAIKSNSILQVDFINDVVDNDQLEQNIEEGILSIVPSVSGRTYWKETNQLVFEPEESFERREQYNATLNLQALSETFKEQKIESFKFNFNVIGREINTFSGEFTLKTKNDPKLLNYRGKVIFSEETSLEKVKEAVSLREGSSSYDLEILEEGDNRTFSFISEDIERDNSNRDFKFIIDSDDLDLSEDFEKEFQLTALDEMKVVDIILLEEGRKPKVRLEFSDEVDFEQNINGLIDIEDLSELKIQKNGSSVVLDADFNFGREYKITVQPGLRSRWGTKTSSKYIREVQFKDILPQVEFASDGVFLPKENEYKLQFYTSNLKRVHVEIKKVYDNGLGEFLQTERLNSRTDRKDAFNNSYINRVGVIVHNETFEISNEKNKFLLSEIDLSDVVSNNEKGLYLVRLNFNPRDMLVKPEKESFKYIEEEGQIYKPLFFTNIGLTCKITKDNTFHVYATDITTAKPLEGAKIIFRKNYYSNNKIISTGFTNNEGMATFSKLGYWGNYYFEAEKNGQRTALKFNEMEWNTSGFDVSGVSENYSGTEAFIYTERGVYRPGDEINISVIARHNDSAYPDNRPITLQLDNPEGQKVYEVVNKNNHDGFYNFKIQTKETDQTGNWRASFRIGDAYFSHVIKVETIVPYKLKVKIEPKTKKILWNHKYLEADVVVNYLFGNPGSDLPVEVDLEVNKSNKTFAKYSNFVFANPLYDFKTIQKKVFKGNLNSEGRKEIKWELPQFNAIPSALSIKLTATVLEKGGRPNKNWVYIPTEPYSNYVGIQPPKYSYVSSGSDLEFPVIMLDPDGKPVSGKTIKYNIYRNSKFWWWYYGNNNRLKYKSDINTQLVKTGDLTSGATHSILQFVPIERGSYFIEVVDESGTGHSSGVFINAYGYGGSGEDNNAGMLALSSDKDKYYVGENAEISFPTPDEGSVLLTVEKYDTIFKQEWYYPGSDEEMKIKLPITKDMAPNVYVSVSLIQPHSQTANDRPIRMFGILPLAVEDKSTKHYFDIITDSQFKPEEEFEVTVQTKDYKQTQFTLAVVDEGILDITQFSTPNPWNHFFKKLRLAVRTYDIFSHIIGANIGDVFKTFAIGGDMDYRKSQLQPEKGKRRFEPVSFFEGPVQTDGNGRATVKFKMPNYVGSVRIMVIGAKGNSYARAEKAVPVKSDLMILPTLPRLAGPDEKFTIPVSVFTMKDKIKDVKVSIDVEGPLIVVDDNTKSLTFTKAGDKDCFFNIQTGSGVGQSKITITAASGSYRASSTIDLMVRPTSPRIYSSVTEKTTPGETLTMILPGDGIEGTNRATLTISNLPNVNFGHRLKWLIHYPYGCIEQTTSSVFPQLYLKKFIQYPEAYSKEIDDNINAGIEKLRRFQTYSGGFSYWPYESKISEWGNLYAGHFLIEAKKLGYHVVEDMYTTWRNFTKQEARRHSGELTYRVYRAYILALDGNSELSEMNALKESSLSQMNNTQKWMLAAAYKLVGRPIDAEQIIANVGTDTRDYNDFSGTYGSGLRDKAMILDASVILEKYTQADKLTQTIGAAVSTRNWYSTQTIGYSLLAIGKYFTHLQGDNLNSTIIGKIVYPNGNETELNETKAITVNIAEGFGKEITLEIDESSTSKNIYATIDWNGVPLVSDVKDVDDNLSIDVDWLDEYGNNIDPTDLQQGTTFFGHFTVENISDLERVDEVALVQVLPSGWEIVNTRLLNETLPSWTQNLILNREDYLDIRDDRAMWFFDLYKMRINGRDYKKLDFVVKLSAVTVGEFSLPGTIVEAMYNNNFKASRKGMKVKVTKP